MTIADTLPDEAIKRFGIRESRTRVRYRTAEFELREHGDTGLTFTGYASVTESPYQRSDFLGDYTETIARGAFKRSLSEGATVDFLVNHNDMGVPMASTRSGTMRLAEDTRGLHVEADLDVARPDVQIVRSAVDRRDLNEMSFAFQVPPGGQTWSKDYSERRITSVNLHHGDVSLVNAGSNPATAGTVGLRAFAGALQEIRAGKQLSSSTMDTLKQVLSLVSSADDAVDQAQPLLAELMGVPNPDADDEAGEPRGISRLSAEFRYHNLF